MLPLLGLRERLHPELDVALVSNPDRSRADIPSHDRSPGMERSQCRMWKGFETCRGPTGSAPLRRIGRRFSQRMLRESLAVLLSRTNTCPTTSARRCSHSRVIEREASELESSRPAMTEKDSDQNASKARPPSSPADRRDWVGYCKTVRRRGCLCLHHGPAARRNSDEAVKASAPTFLEFRRRHCPTG